jgi:Na+-driven multidrug efflux pump
MPETDARPEQGSMKPHTLAFVAGVILMALVFFAWLGQYCPTCAVEEDWGTWGTWIAMFSAGAALAAVGLWRGAKKP